MSIKSWALPLFLCTVTTSALANQGQYTKHEGDEYDYRPTPLANQIADLQDDDRDGVINARDLALIHLRALKSIMMAVAPLSNHHRCSNYIFCLLMTRARLSLRF